MKTTPIKPRPTPVADLVRAGRHMKVAEHAAAQGDRVGAAAAMSAASRYVSRICAVEREDGRTDAMLDLLILYAVNTGTSLSLPEPIWR